MHWDTAIAKYREFGKLRLLLGMLLILGATYLALFAYPNPNLNAAPAPAGSNIANTASATYVDGNGVPRTATSNTVVTVVQQVKSFTLTSSQGKIAAAGQQVCYPHTITNTGNGVDTYSLLPAGSTPVGPPPQFVHTPVIAYYFDNGNGQPTGPAITSTAPLNAGAQFQFVLCATVPASAANGDTGILTPRVSDTSPASIATPTTNTDTTTVSASAITVVKALSSTAPPNVLSPVPSGPSPNGNGQVGAVAPQLFIVLSYSNAGSAPASNFSITDSLPAGMLYVPNSGRWSGSGLTALGDAGPDPAGIVYSAPSSLSVGTVSANIATVPPVGGAGATGYVYFEIAIPPLRAPTDLTNVAETTNTARFTSTQNPTPTPTNPVTYVVSPKRGVVANNTPTSNANAPVNNTVNPVATPGGAPITASSAGQTIYFEDYIWNTGNIADIFDITLPSAGTFPPGTVFALLRSDGSTPLTTSDANSIPDTGVVPVGGVVKVILRATLPINAAASASTGNVANGGPGYQVTLLATSSSTPSVSDPVNNVLANINLRTVDLTATTSRNDSSPAGTANAGNAATTGFGPNNMLPVVNTDATPVLASRTSVILAPLYINNTSAVADSFTLTPPTLPAGWTSEFRLPNAAGTCVVPPVLGAVTNATGTIAANANTIMCVVVSLPPTTSGQVAPGQYPLPITVTSATVPGLSDTLIQQVTVINSRAVDLTATTPRNDSSPAGTANAGNAATTGFGPNNMLPVVNTDATPVPVNRTSVILAPLYINNTSAIADSFTLTPPTLPAGWTSEFRLPNAAGTCVEPPVLGAATNATGTIAANANTIMCVVVSLPPTTSGQVAPGQYPLPITVTSATVLGVADTLIQQVTVLTVRNVTLTPPNAQTTVPGGVVTYSHVFTNLGNVDEPIIFNGPFNLNNLQGWTSTVFLDDGDGVIEIGGDDIVITPNAAGLFTLPKGTLNLGNTRNIWVRVTAPTTPVSDPPPPPNITTTTATYAGGPLVTTDTTTLTEGVSLRKYQQLVSCAATPPVTFTNTVTPNIPDAPWTTAPIGAITNPASAPGQCIAYLVVATNVSGSALTGVLISDTVPVGGPATVQTSCGAAAATTPGSTPTGAVGVGATGAITTIAPTFSISARFHLRFCVQINQA